MRERATQPDSGSGSSPVRVSVLMTSYQHERYVARALEGVLEQRHVSFELIVGDDASTDGTRAIIREYAAAHPDVVRTVLPAANLGCGGKAIFAEITRLSQGEYLAMLDADDYWIDPDKLRRQVDYLDAHPESSMCFHNAWCRYEEVPAPDHLFNTPLQPSRLGLRELLDGCPVAACSPMLRRAALDPLPAWYLSMPWGDWPLYLLAAEHGDIAYLPEVMGVYRIHRGGMYSGLEPLAALEVLTAFYERLREVLPPDHERKRLERLALTWARRGLEHERLSEPAAAAAALHESFRIVPPSLRRVRRGTGEKLRLTLWLRLNLRRVGVQPPPPASTTAGPR